MRCRYLVPILLLLALALPAPTVHASTVVVSVCDEAHLRSALQGEVTVTFTCSGTIVLLAPITISANTTIDGSGQSVVISGNSLVRVFNVQGSIVTLNRLTIADGNANTPNGGGGVYNYLGNVTVSNSTFYGNKARGYSGGAINNEEGTLTVSNSTFYDNSAASGGAIMGALTNITVTNSTFAGNVAIYGGSTIYNTQSATGPSGPVVLKNSIFADHGMSANCSGSGFTNGGGNLSYPDASCPGINSDPLLGPLQNNGGPTPTMALGTGSAAIDASAASCALATDQRGVARPQGAACDIGAVEQQPVGAPRLLLTTIDIKPGSDPNTINCRNANALIAVAILSAEDFDASTVDHRTVTLAGATETHVDSRSGQAVRHLEDVNGDGKADLVFHFRLRSTRLTCDSTLAMLQGRTFDGQPVWGIDSVRMIRGG